MNVDKKGEFVFENWILSMLLLLLSATATTTIFLLVVDYTVKFSFHWDH